MLSAAITASASTFSWSSSSIPQNSVAGEIKQLSTSYNDVTHRFTYQGTFDHAPGAPTRHTMGYWVAVSPGPNPKGHAGELALFYMDVSEGTPVLTAYAYNGVNGGSSYFDGSPAGGTQAPDKIASSLASSSWINALTFTVNGDGTRTIGFDIDASGINSHVPLNPGPGGPGEWTGAAFGETIGIWMHPLAGLDTSYGADGFLTSLSASHEGWFDASDMETVPEPATALALVGFAALARRRRR